jgi:gas vesicle protein
MRSFVLGAITGAALALLLAPYSGLETRDAIGDRVHEVAERIRAARRRMLRGSNVPLADDDVEGVFPGAPA